MQTLDRPILVLGAHRSGKSLVMRIVGESPEVLRCDEPMMVWNIGMRNHADDARDAEEATEAIRSEIIAKLVNLLARGAKRRYCDDLAHNMLRLGFVSRVLPNVRVIVVTRDPRDNIPEIINGWTFKQSMTTSLLRNYTTRRGSVVLRTLPRLAWRALRNQLASQLRGRRESWGVRTPGLAEFASRNSVAEVAAMQWKTLYETTLRSLDCLPELPWTQVRYEDLVSRPLAEARRLAEFCEVEDVDRVATFADTFVEPDFVADRVAMTEREWEAISPRIAPVARRLGYGFGPTPTAKEPS